MTPVYVVTYNMCDRGRETQVQEVHFRYVTWCQM